MAEKPEPIAVAPALPATSVDFNALNDAIAAGKTAAEAVAAAIPAASKVEVVEEDAVSLAGKKKAELLEIAAAEGFEVDPTATNADLIAAIESGRAEAAQSYAGGPPAETSPTNDAPAATGDA